MKHINRGQSRTLRIVQQFYNINETKHTNVYDPSNGYCWISTPSISEDVTLEK